MKITFLGTSHGVPEPGRRCACTMIETAGRVYFVDMGMQAVEDMINRNILMGSVQAIFLTHMHEDHTSGLFSMVELLNWYYKTCNPTIFLPKEEAHELLRTWIMVAECRALRDEIPLRTVGEGVIWDDGYLKVTAFANQHCDRAFSYLLEGEGKRVLFTGDMKRPCIDFPVSALEAPLDAMVGESAHFAPEEYASVLKEENVRAVYIHHYTPKRVPGIRNLTELLKPVPVQIVTDGWEITL